MFQNRLAACATIHSPLATIFKKDGDYAAFGENALEETPGRLWIQGTIHVTSHIRIAVQRDEGVFVTGLVGA